MRNLLLPVLDALEYAHGRGTAHGGISPENIIIAEDGRPMVTDWATADPKAPVHAPTYNGVASVLGDVKALGRVLIAYLPTTGAFASPVVRGRIEGVIGRCDTVADLRETLNTLEKLAAAPVGRATSPGTETAPLTSTVPPVTSEHRAAPWALRPGPPFPSDAPPLRSAPTLITQLAGPVPRLQQGGGGTTSLIVRNEGDAPLILRMVAAQHAWLNVRPLELPITIAPGGSERLEFFLSAARLTPGEYRSEVYLSSNAGGPAAEDLRGGWFKHTSEVRITVEPPGAVNGGPPVPTTGPRTPPVAGCATVLAMGALLVIVSALLG